ncbi:helix-turn-helix domain-containing protein [Dehalobacter sp. DCM]|uniref:PucR family transcriptional regulator n=1 Tax=Dehalobacter sp. DCM TaxID=2907827 RepID=UPI003081DB87|nr:helix-turn-helix domain-containing protein [Dehalobacter sp. DCM]
MAITLPMVLDRIPGILQENTTLFKKRKTDIQDIALLHLPCSEYWENRLYILDENADFKLFLNDAQVLPRNLVYIEENRCFYTGQNIAHPICLSETGFEQTTLLTQLQDALYYYRKMMDDLLTAVGNDAGLQSLTNRMASYLRNPIAIFARGLKLLAHSQNYRMTEKLWTDTEEKGYLEVEGQFSEGLKEQAKMSEHNTSPFIFAADYMPYRIASKTIVRGSNQIGVFQVIEYNTPFSQGILDIMEVMNIYLSIEINKNELINFNHGILHGQLFIDLLERKIDSLQTLKSQGKYHGWLFAKYTFVMVIKPISRFLVDEQLAKIRNQLNVILPFGNCLVYDKGIVVIVIRSSEMPYPSETEAQLLSLLSEWHLCCGLSRYSTNLLDVALLYEQSLQAIKFGLTQNSGNYIYDYCQFALYDFLDSCVANDKISAYYHPALKILGDYDSKHRSALLATLRTYIQNHNNQMSTAKKLFISRSSLLYRLHKIEKMAAIDFDDPNTVFHLLLSFMLQEYAGVES